MTKITFFRKEKEIVGFEISGHTGKENFGKDLLCCQISTVAQLAVVGIDEVAKVKNFHEISDGYLKITVDEKTAKQEKVKVIFQTCFESLKSIIQDEKNYAKMEVKNV